LSQVLYLHLVTLISLHSIAGMLQKQTLQSITINWTEHFNLELNYLHTNARHYYLLQYFTIGRNEYCSLVQANRFISLVYLQIWFVKFRTVTFNLPFTSEHVYACITYVCLHLHFNVNLRTWVSVLSAMCCSMMRITSMRDWRQPGWSSKTSTETIPMTQLKQNSRRQLAREIIPLPPIVVKALYYKLEGRGFHTRWGEFLNLPNPSGVYSASNRNEYQKHKNNNVSGD
jgi:hypothetical protein